MGVVVTDLDWDCTEVRLGELSSLRGWLCLVEGDFAACNRPSCRGTIIIIGNMVCDKYIE